MTRFLKLVRHGDNWKALSTETDDLSEEVAIKEKTCAPIDPQQLLKALDNHLSPNGGIKSKKDVPRLASLMKKFSKKLVSRCVYSNVLQATESEVLSEYLDKGGWETINLWLQYAKTSSSHSFVLEMLKLCDLLPMTLERLKENNTAKLVKSLTKHENEDVKTLSTELVTKWMSIIKEKKAIDAPPVEKKKKKEKSKHETEKSEKSKHETEKTEKSKHEAGKSESKAHTKAESPKGAEKVKGKKRISVEKETKKEEFYEDVKIDPEPLLPPSKKLKVDRPKTAKIYQKKFRATGLEEETPLPKNISKKPTNVDKSTVAAAKNALKTTQTNPVLPERVTEKKIKPENLMTINETSNSNKGIKLIPAKPRPAYVLHESASFMDALTSQPVVPVKKKKKAPPTKQANSPTSPTLAAPKLQFYKDTLETSEDKKEEENEKDSTSNEENAVNEEKMDINEDDEAMEVTTEEGGRTPPNDEASNQSEENKNSPESSEEKEPLDPNQLRSILSHGRRRGSKKSVKWVEDDNIREIFYFELDETERVNVLKTQNFGDMKSIELKREREALEQAKRQAGDRMEEAMMWIYPPILIEVPIPLIQIGGLSKEKEIESLRQQSTLQEIYFTREMIPDSPREPDLEIIPPQEPRIIPIDEDNLIGALMDYSTIDLTKTTVTLPKQMPNNVFPTITNFNPSHPLLPIPNNTNEAMLPDPALLVQSLMNMEGFNAIKTPTTLSQPYDPGEPVNVMPPNSLLGAPPVLQNVFNIASPPDTQNMNSQGDWQQKQFYGNYQINPVAVDQMSNINQGPIMNQGLSLNRSPEINHVPVHNMNRGPEVNQGTNLNCGPDMNQGHNSEMNQGPNMNRGPEMNHGHNMNRIPDMNQGHNVNNRGSNMNHGPNRNRNSEMNHESGMHRGPNQGSGMRPRIMQDSYRPSHKGPPKGTGGPRVYNAHKVPCRHFIANGCRFGMKCSFLHPGVNGPPL